MEGEESRPRGARVVQRIFECSRLEEEFWALAYEPALPEIRRPLAPCAAADNPGDECASESVSYRAKGGFGS